ncbi:MAG: glucans biosynthesis glucosyltransferase MdoH, partial [Gemmatimonadaceae bacterium]|nr:glucans biosynthesis glucosyltransferase MdoH [Acetobacteraceae bacterium]
MRSGPNWGRRAAFVVPIVGATVLSAILAAYLSAGVDDWLRWPLIALLAANMLYTALTGWPTVLGFMVRLFGSALQVKAKPSGLSRTALVMPIHKEDPRAVFAAVEVMARAVADARLLNVDLFVLSDTQDPAVAAAEMAAFAALRTRAPAGPALHYRRRTENTRRKVGNLAEFCNTWGSR